VGGAETYLDELIPYLASRGHEIGLVSEMDAPADRDLITLPATAARWTVETSGLAEVTGAVRAWTPDLLFVHQIEAPSVEAALVGLGPTVLFAHNYHGTCVSGGKTFKNPAVTPCSRRFGWRCLLHYYPHRCGGLSPATMMRDYLRQGARNHLLPRYAAVVTASEHMRHEFLSHGLDAGRVRKLTHYVRRASAAAVDDNVESVAPPRELRLLFVGRMDYLKGGRVLLDALPAVAAGLGKSIRVVLAGDGPDRLAWERKADALQRKLPNVTVDFPGWLSRDEVDGLFRNADLVVVPSLWPEPFGQVGPEAGLKGVPAVAFAVGGIPEWLEDGVNGQLAPADPPTAAGLAAAIVAALRDPQRHARLRQGARAIAERFTLEQHVAELEQVFESFITTK
jgi:glycosyltransferase involved in cell wall biosynthesis